MRYTINSRSKKDSCLKVWWNYYATCCCKLVSTIFFIKIRQKFERCWEVLFYWIIHRQGYHSSISVSIILYYRLLTIKTNMRILLLFKQKCVRVDIVYLVKTILNICTRSIFIYPQESIKKGLEALLGQSMQFSATPISLSRDYFKGWKCNNLFLKQKACTRNTSVAIFIRLQIKCVREKMCDVWWNVWKKCVIWGE